MSFILVRQQGFAWHHRGGAHVKGYLFDGAETFRRDAAAADYFATVTNAGNFCDRLCEANGCFAAIVETDQHILAAVDRVRSLPLFYALNGPDLILGDDVGEMQKRIGECAIDPVAREEFLRIGYTIGPGTLDSRISQIEAGDMLIFDKAGGRVKVKTWFSHVHEEFSDKTEEALLDEFDNITSRWARRLIESARGRTIIVPLSGGYDSRSIVCALKREGYKQVICYSYGVPASYEHQIAQQVAAQLDYPIHIIDYSGHAWRAMLESPRFVEFCRFMWQQCTVPCAQELLAFYNLARASAIPSDAIIVPGYGGDWLAGSRLPAGRLLAGQQEKLLVEGIDQYILRSYFSLLASAIPADKEPAMLGRIHAFTSGFRSDDIRHFCSVLEAWITRHRVAKFLVNTVRTFEFFGHEWRLPFFDNELIDGWFGLPLQHRINKVLYQRYVFERLFKPMNVPFQKPKSPVGLDQVVRQWLPAALIPSVKRLYKVLLKRPVNSIRTKPMDIDGFDAVTEMLLKQMGPGWCADDFGNVNGVVAMWWLLRNNLTMHV
ncbi:MAG: hypothetical protein JW832_16235 [Deltaproteobacteria bacterium]|nr:hypothetical protein [Deltaproteobacteria bacterium]